ncbi:tape measure protein [uncultured Pseudomonas sp.]|uniref:tape measure protein n=1 Tax=uncultured Pseudomonas sp. TaxID=114707 RepID=UPI00258A7FBA|nr:tape measure protein [uncultured Pseudomonas sp.]
MADENIQRMLVQIEATTAGLRRELDKGESSVKRFSDNTDKNVRSAGASFEGMARSVTKIAAPLLGAVSAMEGLQKALEVQRQFDRLNAGLITATGSSEKAAVAFAALQEFAAKTPYSLDQAVEGFSKLVNLGLTPSEKALTSYGNTAAAMGKDLNQMIEAVADAATGEFERLKEFGITSSQQGDKVSLTFRGVTTTIGKSAKEIEGYLMNLGLVDFAGAMDERAKTLDGQISNLGDTWDQTFRLINEKGLGDLMRDAVSTAADALQELNESLDSGQFESYLAAMGDNFDGWGADIQHTLLFLDQEFGIFFRGVGEGAKSSAGFTVEAFRDMPENVRAFIQLMTVEVLAGFDKAQAYAVAFKDSIAAVFNSDTFDDVQKRLQQSLDQTNSVRQGSIEDILAERDTAVQSFKDQTAAADERLRKYREERAESAKSSEDRLAQFSKQTEAAKTLSKEEENKAKQQAKALADLLAQSKISTEAANALADAYLNGQDQLAKFTLQEKISQELLKTGAAARDKVTAAIEGQLNAEARRDVAKATYDLRAETSALDLQAAATLQGKSALEAFNVERAKAAILSGKNVDALTEETRQYLEAFEANQKATKALQQAAEVEGIVDRLQPQAKLLKDYTKEVDVLNKAIELYPAKADQYREAQRLLGEEYDRNRLKASIWGEWTEGAIDRVDASFADAWANIGDGASNLFDNLKKGFKQTLGEIAHMLTTKPLLASFGDWLTGTISGNGLSAVWSKALGAFGGSGSSGGTSGALSGLGSLANNLYSAYSTFTGVGPAVMAGYQAGGISGALSGGAGYYGALVSNAASTVAGWLGMTSAATGAGTAGALNAAAIAGANTVGTSLGYLGSSTVAFPGAAGAAAGTGAAAGSSSFLASLGSTMAAAWPLAVVAGMYASGKLYDAGVRPDGKATLESGGHTAFGKATMLPGAITNQMFEWQDKMLKPLVGGKLAAILSGSTLSQFVWDKVGTKLFGGQWQTKDAGISLGVTGGELDASTYENQKKKGGLFSKSKKRTRYGSLDDDTQSYLDGMFATGLAGIEDLYKRFGIDLTEGAVDGLTVAATQFSSMGKTQEELQTAINGWFTSTFDSITDQLNTATGSQFKAGLTFEGLTTLLNNLLGINNLLETLNVKVLKITPAGAYAAEALQALAGGMDKLTENVNGYYGAFFTEAEKQADTLGAVTKQFAALGVTLPPLRQGYRDIVESIDVTTAAGQAMFTSLTSLWQTASGYYDILQAQSEAAKRAQSDMLSGALGTLQRAVQRQQTALTDAYNAQVEGLNTSLSASQSVMSSMTSMANGLASALKTLQGQSDAAQSVLYQQAQATLVSAAAIARAGGSLAGLAGIDDALSAVTNNDASRYANWEDFARDQGRSLVLIDELNSAAGGQLDQAQASVKALQDQIALAKRQYDMESMKLQGQLDLAQAQIDGINGIDTRLLSVNEALAEILKAISKASPDGTGATNADAIIEAAYRAALGRSADAAGAAYWKQQLASGAVNSNNLSTAIAAAGAANAAAAPSQVASAYASILGRMPTEADMAYWTTQMASGAVTDIGAAIKASAVANGQIPAFASGGSYMGGLALVGERGPEVIDFNRPGYVYNARETAGMLSGADLSGVMGLLAQLLAAVGEGNDHLWFINDRTRATADNTEVLRDQALKEATV